MIIVGTAGWSIPRAAAAAFPGTGAHLERYAQVFKGTEINSSFHRRHATRIYERWASLTPPDFRFSVKLPRAITHEGELRRSRVPLDAFFSDVAGLGAKLGPLLVQLPPSLEFNARVARTFFELLRDRHAGPVVCEPRHASWFTTAAGGVLVRYQVGRVAADPSRIPGAGEPAGWMGSPDSPGVLYYRLHGSPRKYWSRYPVERIARWADEFRARPSDAVVWCIFDNTASGAAMENALELVLVSE
jgi:uncharacterized protein YecE (DUF72 family)